MKKLIAYIRQRLQPANEPVRRSRRGFTGTLHEAWFNDKQMHQLGQWFLGKEHIFVHMVKHEYERVYRKGSVGKLRVQRRRFENGIEAGGFEQTYKVSIVEFRSYVGETGTPYEIISFRLNV